jgi:hypothetical protein
VRLFRQTFSLSTVWLPFFYYTGIWNFTVCDPGDPRQRLLLEGLHVLAIALPRTDRTENTWARSYLFTELLAFFGLHRSNNEFERRARLAYVEVLRECSNETDELEFIEWTISHGGSFRGSGSTSLESSSVDSSAPS